MELTEKIRGASCIFYRLQSFWSVKNILGRGRSTSNRSKGGYIAG